MFSWIAAVTRIREWWWYKIPPLLATGYALLLVRGVPMNGVVSLALAIMALCCVAAFAYTVNDATDGFEDWQRGKPNAVGRLPRAHRIGIALAFAAAAILIATLLNPQRWAVALFVFELSLPLLYSLRPVRLKERGVWGLIADAAMVHVIPTLWIGLMLAPAASRHWRYDAVLVALLVASVGLGLRGALLHQRRIHEAGHGALRPFISRLPDATFQQIVLRLLLPMEWTALLAGMLFLVPLGPLLAAIAALVVVMESTRGRANWRIPFLRDSSGNEPRYVPLIFNEVQEIILPLGLAVQLALISPWLVILALAHALAFWPSVRELWSVAVVTKRAVDDSSERLRQRPLNLADRPLTLPTVSRSPGA